MAISLSSNIASSKAQGKLSQTTSTVSKNYEKLSSGLRINHASDDAAGLAIATALNSKQRIMSAGVRNINDAISLLNIADGATQELSNILGRILELAEQSANGTNNLEQRSALDKEAQALRNEYNRILTTTEFNGRKIADGSMGSLQVQAGLDSTSNSQLAVSLDSFDGGSVSTGGAVAVDGNQQYVEVAYNSQLLWAGGEWTVEGWFNRSTSDAGQGSIFSQAWNGSGIYSYLGTINADGAVEIHLGTTANPGAGQDPKVYRSAAGVFQSGQWNHLAVVIDDQNSPHLFINGEETPMSFFGYDTAYVPGSLNVGLAIGTYYPHGEPWGGGASTTPFTGSIDQFRVSNVARYTSTFSASRSQLATDSNTLLLLNFEEGSGTTARDDSGNGRNGTLKNSATWTQGYSPTTAELAPFSIQSRADALDTLRIIGTSLTNLSTSRGKLGAFQSRTEIAARNLESMRTQFAEAESRIVDVDVAQSTSELIRNQVLQQFQTAILSQSSLQHDIALQLLET